MSHVPQLCRQAAELVPREVEVGERSELDYVWRNTLKEGGRGAGWDEGEKEEKGERERGRERKRRERKKREEREERKRGGEGKLGASPASARTAEGGTTLPKRFMRVT